MPRLLGFGSWKTDGVDGADSNVKGSASQATSSPGTTLLPRPVASLVSLVTQSTSLSLRLGTFFGGVALDGARITTLTGLELSRAVIEGILTRAGRDVAIRSSGAHGRAEAESMLERSIAALHTTVTSASFFAAATFHFSSTTLSSAANMSQALLSTLDAILGSTESSRAIAAIITLIRKEFRNQGSEIGSEKIGVGDLLVGTVGFAMLQRWGRKNTERYIRANSGEETVWDVVILDNGIRADVVETHQIDSTDGTHENMRNLSRQSSFMSPGIGEEEFRAVQRPVSTPGTAENPSTILPENQHQISDEDIHLYIMKQLPQGCRASIRTDWVTARTITVDVFDDDNREIAAPPGTMIVEERFHNDPHNGRRTPTGSHTPRHTIVFRTAFNKTQSADVRPHSRQVVGTSEVNDDQQRYNPQGLQKVSLSEAPDSESNVPNGSLDIVIKQPWPDVSMHLQKQHRAEASDAFKENYAASKSGFTKSSLTKIAQKVKPITREKNELSKRPSVRPPFDRSNTQPSPGNSIQRSKAYKGSTTERKVPAQAQASKSVTQARPGKLLVPSKTAPSSSVANRGVPRTPLQDARIRPSSPEPSSHRTNKCDPNHGRGPRAGYYQVHEKESYMARTDAYSLSRDSRCSSPKATRTHVRSSSSLSLTRSETETTVTLHNDTRQNPSSFYQRSTSYSSSIYSLATAGSETSLVLAHRSSKSAYDDTSIIQALNRDGLVPGIFPQKHFVQNIRRFCRFASASYGSNALKVMGVPQAPKIVNLEDIGSQEHSDFSGHTGLPASTILLSSFVDPEGGSNAAGETENGFPLVHYLFLDHESKAVVLALRGTWGFEDVLTDMTCDYDDLEWQGKSWKVHKGMHASANHLLMGGGKRVMITIRAALEEFPEYGVVLCGHSLGGGVAALLATMISEPGNEASRTSFTTTSYSSKQFMLRGGKAEDESHSAIYLPPGRPIHVYAYGPPATMSPFLRRATRGLITTIVNGQDVVPSLSLGILHDMHTASVAFKSDVSDAKSHVRYRVWESLRQSILNKFYVHETPILLHAGDGLGEDAWAWKTLKTLRESMCAPKLVPPGEVFVVETMRVLQRNAFTSDSGEDGYPRLGKPATRVQLKFIRDVETRFGELKFGSGMFSDHNPARYEASLAGLTRGILDE
ncbi:hypothetical protein P175DRAFT_0464001 [Aspergillus ochraceoroseus IBT 24754]|uniref:sn-1-specific diacylglycerol lipase n=2 Tax=Aspergillus ochraceoroseus TaxID=138278 RepID=A0A2T5LRG8_9EURO|nr:uncharacterized protein P175DRAFT_0464001 [Aspergillus ochraceoroseus IBT 24754]KKK15046.1 hypothetical protein AOCH_002116 [Aspergillus ochraceoroseus]PTU18875.1 hypothetical protein P175DRAFT_0464001 [Aspergillus ochraceoroseus IBT 24754]